jgi:pimeloyl-ACP methyl ester carboxylesterase
MAFWGYWTVEAQNSTVRMGAEVDADRCDTGAFGGPTRGRGNGAIGARVLNFPGGGALEVTAKSERLVQVGGRKLLVRRSGTGPPILLLTGIGMSLAAWTPLVRHLHGFECIEVAMPGSAGFVARHPVLTMPRFAALARGLLDRLDIARADVLGLSFGGLVAQQLAHDAPTRVRGLVLVSTSCGLGGAPSNPAIWWSAMLSGVWPASGRPGAQRLVRRWSRVLRRELGAGWSTGPRLGGVTEQIAAASLWSSLLWLPRLTQETLVITGTADALVPAANASILASRMPRAQVHRVHGGGHMCLLDRAAEVGPVVAAFLRSLERTAVNEVAEFG